MKALKATALTGLLLGLSLFVSGCQVAPGNTVRLDDNGNPIGTATSPVIPKPVAQDGSQDLSAITVDNVFVSPTYQEDTGAGYEQARAASDLGLQAMKVFTLDFAKYQKNSESLNQEELLALLPEVEEKMKPLMFPGTLEDLSKKWKEGASDASKLENSVMMFATDQVDDPSTALPENSWKNSANLECVNTDTEWSTTFSEPQLTAIPAKDADYKVTAFKIKAHYLIPCADGKVLSQNMDWTLGIGPDPTGSFWQIYSWERLPIGDAAYI
jgi:hypothetical protein